MSTLDTSGNALVDDITARIRAMIMSGEIPIGAQLRQAELASQFNISRTPIREALRQLQSGGLIEVVPNRGAIVRVPIPWEVREAYEVRAELEALATERAVSRISRETIASLREANARMWEHSRALADATARGESPVAEGEGNDAFHELILATSGNARLARAISEINEAFPRNVSSLVLMDDPRHREDNYQEHERIIDALEAGDAKTARAEMSAHVLNAGEHLAHWYERRSRTILLDKR
ncbi:GntR family transcriptional regulator [Lacisediminihabitans profunda]|uniref:GntR family transcriptional regulator n=1 Tax=Lacisediminihabitans profunda TaxID=2594790 RepID=A0A5C8UQ48_9MICO|nr:GntR family transcriptional regulator [Lacisediminihabitans profunda]TXN30409.1 GntR family transcriptional regulator [Lacisediminihabitans profunda]